MSVVRLQPSYGQDFARACWGSLAASRLHIRSDYGRFLERRIPVNMTVKNGTPLHGLSLCETCSNGHVARGYRETEVLVVCRATSPEYRVAFPVRECSSYIDKNRQTLYEMGKIAWVLSPRGSKHAGFVPVTEDSDPGDEIELILSKEK
jgi:hypothetical protein